jgi:hypothetical protein
VPTARGQSACGLTELLAVAAAGDVRERVVVHARVHLDAPRIVDGRVEAEERRREVARVLEDDLRNAHLLIRSCEPSRD